MITHPGPSEYPTVSQASHTPLILISFIIFMLMLLLTGCSSTAIDEPAKVNSSTGDDLVITLSMPDTYTFPSTRAEGDHDGHFLRYTAILYSSKNSVGTSGNISNKPADDDNGVQVRRIEKLDKEGNTIVFQNITAGKYFIVVFADYVNNDTKGIDGYYEDTYYDTKSKPNEINIKNQTDQTVFFNNHNLDFFIDQTKVFQKEEGKAVEYKFTLTRHVSQVQVFATGEGSIDALKDVTIKTCKVMDGMMLANGNSYGFDQKAIVSGNVQINVADRGSKMLFFYYTFSVSSTGSMLEATTFTLNPNEGYSFTNADREVPGSKINPQANIIYKVQGDFLSTSQMPSKVAEIKVTTDQNWNNQDHNLSQN